MTTARKRRSAAFLTRAEFQRAIGQSRAAVDRMFAQGLPHETVGSGRGATIRIPRDAAMAWLAKRNAPEERPPIPAWLVGQAPGVVGVVLAALEAIYATPWFVRVSALDEGCPPELVDRIATGSALVLATHFERGFRELGLAHFAGSEGEIAWIDRDSFWWLPGRGVREDLALAGVGKGDVPAA